MFATRRINESKTKNESRRVIARRLKVEQRRIMREMYRKRRITLIKKTHELEKLCEVDVAIIICRNDRYFIYRSMNRRSWSSSMKQIVSVLLVQSWSKLTLSKSHHTHCLRIFYHSILKKNVLWSSRSRLMKIQRMLKMHKRRSIAKRKFIVEVLTLFWVWHINFHCSLNHFAVIAISLSESVVISRLVMCKSSMNAWCRQIAKSLKLLDSTELRSELRLLLTKIISALRWTTILNLNQAWVVIYNEPLCRSFEDMTRKSLNLRKSFRSIVVFTVTLIWRLHCSSLYYLDYHNVKACSVQLNLFKRQTWCARNCRSISDSI